MKTEFFDSLSDAEKTQFFQFQKEITAFVINGIYDRRVISENDLITFLENHTQTSLRIRFKCAFQIYTLAEHITRAAQEGLPKHLAIRDNLAAMREYLGPLFEKRNPENP